MDNVTHTLAGAAVAELVLRARAARGTSDPPTLRGALWLSSMLASNAPDLDVVLTPTLRAPLGYLLHHRGHTHTVLVAPLLGALATAAGAVWARRRGTPLGRPHLVLLGIVSTLMVLLHVAMDFGNSYGVHPFWPFDARWIYGDSIFILEPTLWMALAIPLAFSVETQRARAALGTLAGLGLVLSATVPLVSTLGLAFVVFVALIAAASSRALGALGRPIVAVLLATALEATFFVVHVEAEIHARGALAGAFPRATTLDVAMTPSPANPLCWGALGIAIEGDDLVTRRFALSLAGDVQDVDGCRLSGPDETTAPHVAIERSTTESLRFFDETRTPLALLRSLDAESPEVEAFLRFSRAPYLLVREDETTVAGDVRYDREAGLGFGELEIRRDGTLGGLVPGWEPPRIDAIDPARTPPRRVHDIVSE